MKEKHKNTILAAYALAELKSRFNLTPDIVIPNYNKEKSAIHFNSMFPNGLSKEELITLANTSYKKLKIK